MKITKHLFFIMILMLFLSCNNNKNIERTNKESKQIKQTLKNLVKKDVLKLSQTNEKLSGRYYVENFTFFAKQGFGLTKVKPINDFVLYEFNFKKNGEIEFKDLTERYDCGNGIITLKNSKFYSKSNDEYVIEFTGKYEAEQRFRVKAIYQLTKIEKNGYFLFLKKVIEDKREPIYGYQ
ncbi:hypothetical protein [Flavobacterium sp. KACC 22761]|uniref:hypothetical protein n=1 Tax=Flavobacterium sp. KACC 22761 TaxID=3092665 RepID=UPI002A74B9AF|nr:hypothetical protein [Flavobacterium sp. KACC 22761]WPO77325.1 hypothetical protein SCB73_13730 [Flavobacterium sp. KACC 22761]